jgi:hypothetical protein
LIGSKGLLPTCFGNYLRVDRLSRDAAAEAIRKPIAHLNGTLRPEEQYSIDLELVDQLLREVSTGRVVISEMGMGRVATAEHTVDTPYMQTGAIPAMGGGTSCRVTDSAARNPGRARRI